MATSGATASALNRVKYAGLDFGTFEDELTARLQVQYAAAYNDFVVSSLGIMLIDLFSYGLDTLAFYLDRRATDNFLSTARARKSVQRTTRQLGYKMGAATASSVDVQVQLAQAYPFDVPIPIGFVFNGPNGLQFVAQQAFTFPASTTPSALITCSEGVIQTAVFTSDGTANQVFQITNVPKDKFIVGPGTVGQSPNTVTVNGTDWTENELLTFGATDQFEIGYNDEPPTLRFGDSVAGNIPPLGAQIRMTYFASSGSAGSATVDTIKSPTQPLSVNFTPISLVITNPQGTSGGDNPETIESAKANAPLFFKSRGVNVTAEDYQVRGGTFRDPVLGAIAVAHAVNVTDATIDAYLSALLAQITSDAQVFDTQLSTGVSLLTGLGIGTSSLDTILSALAAAATAMTQLATALGTIATAQTSIVSTLSSARASVSAATSDSQQVQSILTGSSVTIDIKGIIDSIVAVGSNQLDATTRANLYAAINAAGGLNTTVQGSLAGASANLTTLTTSAGQIGDALNTGNQSTTALVAVVNADIASAQTQGNTAITQALALKTNTHSVALDVASLATQISQHVSSFLSSDCKANLVEVPVLTLDSDGFYVIPTISLMKSLQSYLDAKKEVTQVIKVIGGTNQLVLANISASVGVYSGFVEATVRANVQALILNVLKGRAFGSTLFLSDLYGPITPSSVDGLAHINIYITGPTSNLEIVNGQLTGNLLASPTQVISRGLISVTSSIVPANS